MVLLILRNLVNETQWPGLSEKISVCQSFGSVLRCYILVLVISLAFAPKHGTASELELTSTDFFLGECDDRSSRQTLVMVDYQRFGLNDNFLQELLFGPTGQGGLLHENSMLPNERFDLVFYDSSKKNQRVSNHIRGCFPGAHALRAPSGMKKDVYAQRIKQTIRSQLARTIDSVVKRLPAIEKLPNESYSLRDFNFIVKKLLNKGNSARIIVYGELIFESAFADYRKISLKKTSPLIGLQRASVYVVGVRNYKSDLNVDWIKLESFWHNYVARNGGWLVLYHPDIGSDLFLDQRSPAFERGYLVGRGLFGRPRKTLSHSASVRLDMRIRNDDAQTDALDWLTLTAKGREVLFPISGTMTCPSGQSHCLYSGKIKYVPPGYEEYIQTEAGIRLRVGKLTYGSIQGPPNTDWENKAVYEIVVTESQNE